MPADLLLSACKPPHSLPFLSRVISAYVYDQDCIILFEAREISLRSPPFTTSESCILFIWLNHPPSASPLLGDRPRCRFFSSYTPPLFPRLVPPNNSSQTLFRTTTLAASVPLICSWSRPLTREFTLFPHQQERLSATNAPNAFRSPLHPNGRQLSHFLPRYTPTPSVGARISSVDYPRTVP